jgi:antitoxin Phd
MNRRSTPLTQLPVRQGETTAANAVSVTEAKNNLAQLIDRVRAHERVVITRNDRPTAVLLSVEDYTAMVEAIPDPLRELEKRFEALISAVSSPATVAASAAMTKATPAELGAAAHAAARSRND